MKKMIAAAVVVCMGVAGGAASVQAQEPSYYAGLGMGALSVDYKAAGIDQKKASFGAYANFGADFNEYFAAEMRVGMTGKDKQTYAGSITRAFSSPTFISVLGKFKYPVSSDFNLYMVAGATTARIKGTMTSPAGSLSQTQTKTGLSLGAGFDYSLDKHVSVGSEWVQYMFPVKLKTGNVFAAGSKARMWGITGNVTYHF